VTKVGRFIRRTKLDELPQLINVAKGEMSLVGPRPEVPRYMALYSDAQRRIILSVKPGMTDFAAIELRDEEALLAGYADHHKAYVEVLMPMKARLYSRYVEEQGLLTDLTLIARTISAILFK
jgi:lipopolysaccharide/colanic/teichoic acid biosynthesis glycosyltransferase